MGVGRASLWSIRLAKKHGIMVQAIASAGSGKTSTCSEAGRKENNKI
jgi:hypothetical protein